MNIQPSDFIARRKFRIKAERREQNRGRREHGTRREPWRGMIRSKKKRERKKKRDQTKGGEEGGST